MNSIQKQLLEEVSDLHKIPAGAISVRINGKSEILNSTAEIILTPKENKQGLDIKVLKNTKNKSLHIPALIDNSNFSEDVFNDFVIEDNCEITIVAGCGIHTQNGESQHAGIHSFVIGKNCKIKYIEKHIGLGNIESKKIINPTTKIFVGENSIFEMETHQIGGVSTANRNTTAKLNKNAKLIVKEKILTEQKESSITNFTVELEGENCATEIISRSVAKNNSFQEFNSTLIGKTTCFGRVECDGILLDNAKIYSTPKVMAESTSASLSHEAQIGKIAGEQLTKLMTLGLTQTEAENMIISGYLK